jgi:hypothetical protein
MFRNNEDKVNELFTFNRMKSMEDDEIELEQDPTNIKIQ